MPKLKERDAFGNLKTETDVILDYEQAYLEEKDKVKEIFKAIEDKAEVYKITTKKMFSKKLKKDKVKEVAHHMIIKSEDYNKIKQSFGVLK